MKKRFLVIIMSCLVVGGVFVGCGGNDKNTDTNGKEQTQNIQVKTTDVMTEIKKLMPEGKMPPTGDIDETMAKEKYKINLENVEEFSGVTGLRSPGLIEAAVFKVKDGKVADVKKNLEDYKSTLMPYPDEQDTVKNSKIVEKGNYIGFFVIPALEDGTDTNAKAVEAFENAIK